MRISKQTRSGWGSLLMAVMFTSALTVSAMLVFGTQPGLTAPAKKSLANKCTNGKLSMARATLKYQAPAKGIAPPAAPIQIKDWWKAQPENPLNFRSLGMNILPALSFDEGCPSSDSCGGNCGGGLSCGVGTFMQALSECEMRCCWCGNPGSCSSVVNCNPYAN
ncbi:MAG: hypothetical protein JNJ50_22300 [Acidobacteria bacterium]|nr:hypothetical protein [Acidobacteriota bacterium]